MYPEQTNHLQGDQLSRWGEVQVSPRVTAASGGAGLEPPPPSVRLQAQAPRRDFTLPLHRAQGHGRGRAPALRGPLARPGRAPGRPGHRRRLCRWNRCPSLSRDDRKRTSMVRSRHRARPRGCVRPLVRVRSGGRVMAVTRRGRRGGVPRHVSAPSGACCVGSASRWPWAPLPQLSETEGARCLTRVWT